MECLEYDEKVSRLKKEQRLRYLQTVLSSFLQDDSSCAEIRYIALMVAVSSVVAHHIHVRKQSNAFSSKPYRGEKDGERGQRREDRAALYRRCTTATTARLWQAHEDAVLLTTWMRSRFPQSLTEVIVSAVLEPQSWSEWELYRTWQQQEEAKQFSPLRHAACITVRLEELVNKSSLSQEDFANEKKVDLSTVLLSHQQLLLDLTWCIMQPPFDFTRLEQFSPEKGSSYHVSSAELRYRNYLDFLQNALSSFKGKSVGVVVRYYFLIRLLCGSSVSSSAFLQEKERPLPAAEEERMVLRNKLASVQWQLTTLYRALYDSVKGWGSCCVPRLILSHGGGSNPSRMKPFNAGSGEGDMPSAGTAETWMSKNHESLEHVRSLRDIYSLLNVLDGQQHRIGSSFDDALAFCRALSKRLDRHHMMYAVGGSSWQPPVTVKPPHLLHLPIHLPRSGIHAKLFGNASNLAKDKRKSSSERDELVLMQGSGGVPERRKRPREGFEKRTKAVKEEAPGDFIENTQVYQPIWKEDLGPRGEKGV